MHPPKKTIRSKSCLSGHGDMSLKGTFRRRHVSRCRSVACHQDSPPAFLLASVIDELGAGQLQSKLPVTLRVHHPLGVAESVSLLRQSHGGLATAKTIASGSTFGAQLLFCDLEDKLKSHRQIAVRRWSDVSEYRLSTDVLLAPPNSAVDCRTPATFVGARFGVVDEVTRCSSGDQ